jgi:ubiquinone/menaquinone biosynthesis C-methylase UbiE
VKIGKWLFAALYHYVLTSRSRSAGDDPLTRDVRRPLLAQARGDVLEIGAGDGGNLPHYPPGISLTLLEPNPYMIRYLEDACQRVSGIECVSVVEGHGEVLPFPDHHFDTVVTTHVLCSVRDQAQVLAEVRRVLRPGGCFLFIEHVAAHPQTRVHRLQQMVNPVWRRVGDGCHLTRHTGAAIHAAGFSSVDLADFHPEGFPAIARPHVAGTACA